MRAQTIIARTDAAIAAYGQTVTLQRMAVDPSTGTGVATNGHVHDEVLALLAGTATAAERG